MFRPVSNCWSACRLAGFLLVAGLPASSPGATVNLGPFGELQASLAQHWTLDSELLDDGFDLTILPDAGSVNAMGHIKVFFPTGDALATINQIRAEAARMGAAVVAESVEQRVELKRFDLTQGYGAYSSFTDLRLVGQPPIPGDYKTLSTGIIRLAPGVVATVTILCDDLEGDAFRELLAAVQSLKLGPPSPPARRADI